jgi:hypothetical protein
MPIFLYITADSFTQSNIFSQLLNVHRVSDVRQIEIHTVEPLVSDSCQLPSDGRPLLLRIYWNMFTESLLSNGYGANQSRKHLLQHLSYCCMSVLQALPSNGSTLLLVAGMFTELLPSNGYMRHNIYVIQTWMTDHVNQK